MGLAARALFGATCTLALAGCFYFKAAGGQLELINSQVPVAEAAIREPDPARRWMLTEVPKILGFARDVLLLRPTGSYRGYVETEARGLTFVVTASEATRFEAHTWWFPVAGEVAYKSHFNEPDAQAEAAELRARGLDVWVGPSRAYSTLGLFRDPVVTTMMRRGPIAFVEVLIHELAHARLYVPGHTDFNEQLATFVGHKGTEMYFSAARFAGTGSLAAVRAARREDTVRQDLIYAAIAALEALYDRGLPRAQVLRQRAPILSDLEQQLHALSPDFPAADFEMNNARLMQYRRYGRDAPYLTQMWSDSGGNFRRFWQLVDAYAETLADQPPP
ncbi:MAG: aminopeptidase [Myxococcales bacterium]|nr:aminopeptidase [Myxococcales bacterium]